MPSREEEVGGHRDPAGECRPDGGEEPDERGPAGIDGDDHLVVVATDKRFLHNVTTQLDVEAHQWSGWTIFGIAGGPTQIALDYNADGRLSFFSHLLQPNSSGLWLKSQMAFDSTEWEWIYTQLAPDAVNQYAVVRDLTPPTG